MSELPVTRIGSCRIVEELASGGMAVVYKAVQESLNRTVAIKALKTSVAQDAQFVTRFEREAMSVSSLQHENIIHIYDFQRVGGSLFIIMEYVEGIDLYDLLERCPQLPADVAAIVAMQVARALDYAHYRGIIHRDIKPANIMIGKSGGVKLMDFGIARDQAFGDLTETGTGLGTPSYMSPEQILGDKLDYRSDMFALGVVLYQMLAGRKPFVEDEHKSVMHKIRLERPTPVRKLNPNVPRELERILSRCLAKKKEDRFRSTQDLVLALERFIGKRVDINYHARLVLFLREQKVITDEEADAQLHPAVAGGYKKPSLPGPLGWEGMRRLVTRQAAVLTGMALAVSIVHAAQPSPQMDSRPASAPPPPGFLKVSVDPWAEIYIDGKLVETTPFSRALTVPEGEHKLLLKNPYFREAASTIQIKRGQTSSVKLALERK